MQVTTVGIDLAKHVFQVHGVDADGEVRSFVVNCAGRRWLAFSRSSRLF